MNSNLLTNSLLMIIAVLLLVLVIQNGMNQPTYTRSSSYKSSPHGEGDSMPSTSAPMKSMQMPIQMVFHSVKAFPAGCKGKANLADCDSAEAQKVKAQIEKVNSEGRGPRETFDYIVNTWGESALSDEAAAIRRQRLQAR